MLFLGLPLALWSFTNTNNINSQRKARCLSAGWSHDTRTIGVVRLPVTCRTGDFSGERRQARSERGAPDKRGGGSQSSLVWKTQKKINTVNKSNNACPADHYYIPVISSTLTILYLSLKLLRSWSCPVMIFRLFPAGICLRGLLTPWYVGPGGAIRTIAYGEWVKTTVISCLLTSRGMSKEAYSFKSLSQPAGICSGYDHSHNRPYNSGPFNNLRFMQRKWLGGFKFWPKDIFSTAPPWPAKCRRA